MRRNHSSLKRVITGLESARLVTDIAPMSPTPRRSRRAALALAPMLFSALLAPRAFAQAQQPRRQPINPPQQAALSANDQADIARVEQYLNGITSAQARFMQTNPNGTSSMGNFYIRRPGRLRFEYDPPSKLLIVADGFQVTMYDPATRDFGQWPIGWTAASFLVAPQIRLSGDIRVLRVDRAAGELRITMVQEKKPNEGRIEVVLGDAPLQLRRWTIWDARNVPVEVVLSSMRAGVFLPDHLFAQPIPKERDHP